MKCVGVSCAICYISPFFLSIFVNIDVLDSLIIGTLLLVFTCITQIFTAQSLTISLASIWPLEYPETKLEVYQYYSTWFGILGLLLYSEIYVHVTRDTGGLYHLLYVQGFVLFGLVGRIIALIVSRKFNDSLSIQKLGDENDVL